MAEVWLKIMTSFLVSCLLSRVSCLISYLHRIAVSMHLGWPMACQPFLCQWKWLWTAYAAIAWAFAWLDFCLPFCSTCLSFSPSSAKFFAVFRVTRLQVLLWSWPDTRSLVRSPTFPWLAYDSHFSRHLSCGCSSEGSFAWPWPTCPLLFRITSVFLFRTCHCFEKAYHSAVFAAFWFICMHHGLIKRSGTLNFAPAIWTSVCFSWTSSYCCLQCFSALCACYSIH